MATIPIDPHLVQTLLPARPEHSHKGDFGSVGVIGGAPGMAGAALLAARAALWLGAGRVYGGLLDRRIAADFVAPELMLTTPSATLEITPPGCLVIGPGLGRDPEALDWLKQAIGTPLPLLIDADALNLLAAHPVLATRIARRAAPTLLTPHPGEAARLAGSDSPAIQADRAGSARRLAERYRAIVILKGAGTLVCTGKHGNDTAWHNTTGNPGMAAPGMGDVLAGMIAALIAQGADPVKAACAGVHLHGLAGDRCVRDDAGPRGLTASEVARCARLLLNGRDCG